MHQNYSPLGIDLALERPEAHMCPDMRVDCRFAHKDSCRGPDALVKAALEVLALLLGHFVVLAAYNVAVSETLVDDCLAGGVHHPVHELLHTWFGDKCAGWSDIKGGLELVH